MKGTLTTEPREPQLSFLVLELFLRSQENHKDGGLPHPTCRTLLTNLQLRKKMPVTSREPKEFVIHDLEVCD